MNRDDQLSPIDGAVAVSATGEVARVLPPELPGNLDPAPAELTDDEKLAALATAETQRQALSVRSLNLDSEDRPHFLRVVDGVETCGQDGRPWPCPTYEAMQADQQASQLTPAGEAPGHPDMRDLATLRDTLDSMGVTDVAGFLRDLKSGRLE